MNVIVPAPDVLPVAWGYLEGFLFLMFPLHLILMNCLVGGVFWALMLKLFGNSEDHMLACVACKPLPVVFAFTVNFGVAALLFSQVLYGNYFYVSSILMGSYWLAVVPLIMLGYYGLYIFNYRCAPSGRRGGGVLALVVSVCVVVAFFFTNNMTLMLEPAVWQKVSLNTAGTSLNLDHSGFWARLTHILLGAAALGGLYFAGIGRYRLKDRPDMAQKAFHLGFRVFWVVSLFQVGVGAWFLMSLPAPVRKLFMGTSVLGTALLTASMVLALAVVFLGVRKQFAGSVIASVLTMVLMTLMRDIVRDGYLGSIIADNFPAVEPQYSPMALFLVVLAAGFAVVVWIVATYRKEVVRTE